jgi:hypothetical protein
MLGGNLFVCLPTVFVSANCLSDKSHFEGFNIEERYKNQQGKSTKSPEIFNKG